MFDKLKNVAEDLAAKAEEAKTTGTDVAEAAAEKIKEAVSTEDAAKADKSEAAAPKADKPEAAAAKADKPEATKAAKAESKADTPKAEGSGGARTYTVKSGDTLSAIGAKYGVSYQAIAKASGIDNPDLIFPGQVLTIPEK